MKTGRLKYDFAYGCFLFCGMTALLITIIGKAAKDDNTSALLGFFVAIPLAFASIAAMVAALVLSMMLWRHWPLLILSALTVLSVAVIAMVHGSEAFYNSAAILYGVGVVAMTGRWFLVLRRRHFPAAVEE
jgi:hypothetical protein